MRMLSLLPLLMVCLSGCGEPPAGPNPAPAATAATAGAPPAKLDGARIEELTGLKGSLDAASGVFKVTAPRSEVKVTVDGWPMPPFMGRTSWAGFQAEAGGRVMVMGDLALFQDEVNPVMSVCLEGGLEVTALHNHFFYDNPQEFFMHIGGDGTVETLAPVIKTAIEKIRDIRTAQPMPASGFGGAALPEQSAIDAAALETVFGKKAQAQAGMCKFVFGRTATMDCGCKAGGAMGVNTWAAFAGTDDNAAVCGDFAVHEGELQAVLKSLRKSGVNIVAIHHHMVGETPRILFLHYWGRGKSAELAVAVQAALAQVKE